MQRITAPTSQLSRNISSTWQLTLAGITFFNLTLVYLWHGAATVQVGTVGALMVLVVGLIWAGLAVVMMYRYRWIIDADHAEGSWTCRPWVVVAAVTAAVALGVLTWISIGLVVASIVPVAQVLVMLRWSTGVRSRFALGLTAVLVALAILDYRHNLGALNADAPTTFILLLAYAAIIPGFTVFSLWWWDIVVELDQARLAEGELAATRERLRLANDIHDLQGHHLQVVALQLELAERVLALDQAAGLEHVHEARRTVATAQAETRNLAERMRPVNLRNELENAAELLRVAGAEVTMRIAPNVATAPSEVLAPVIRETTTNALRHGGGKKVDVALDFEHDQWQYAMKNDVDCSNTSENLERQWSNGSGLASIKQRVREHNGQVAVEGTDTTHTVTVVLPHRKEIH
ncbi:sensor histidine kinase [Timonella senegalensis]|uniref:sensor histidine kinase n=1 Tax=Timonella senegalensis TaxID=1465825 RepID=UPI0002EC9D42|nr:histidine kinase [Timonella senegalensis]